MSIKQGTANISNSGTCRLARAFAHFKQVSSNEFFIFLLHIKLAGSRVFIYLLLPRMEIARVDSCRRIPCLSQPS